MSETVLQEERRPLLDSLSLREAQLLEREKALDEREKAVAAREEAVENISDSKRKLNDVQLQARQQFETIARKEVQSYWKDGVPCFKNKEGKQELSQFINHLQHMPTVTDLFQSMNTSLEELGLKPNILYQKVLRQSSYVRTKLEKSEAEMAGNAGFEERPQITPEKLIKQRMNNLQTKVRTTLGAQYDRDVTSFILKNLLEKYGFQTTSRLKKTELLHELEEYIDGHRETDYKTDFREAKEKEARYKEEHPVKRRKTGEVPGTEGVPPAEEANTPAAPLNRGPNTAHEGNVTVDTVERRENDYQEDSIEEEEHTQSSPKTLSSQFRDVQSPASLLGKRSQRSSSRYESSQYMDLPVSSYSSTPRRSSRLHVT